MDSMHQSKMVKNAYDDLKKKYEELLHENQRLKARIREMELSCQTVTHPHEPAEALLKEPEKPIANPKSGTPTLIVMDRSAKPVNQYSGNYAKIVLFMSLFRGRDDVYAKKWQNQKGLSGYSPVCLNEWKSGICQKPRLKCSKCGNQSHETLNESVIEKHLRGAVVIGVYPLNLDETCHFLAIDFDKQEWRKDIAIIRDTCSGRRPSSHNFLLLRTDSIFSGCQKTG